MIDLLKVCSHFSCPSIDELSMKFVNFGQPTRQKVLVLDMDETLIHAKFLSLILYLFLSLWLSHINVPYLHEYISTAMKVSIL